MPATCVPMTPAMPPTTPMAISTASSTAATWGRCQRWKRDTSGASMKDRITATVMGSSTSRAKYSAAITTTATARDRRPVSPGVSAAATAAGARVVGSGSLMRRVCSDAAEKGVARGRNAPSGQLILRQASRRIPRPPAVPERALPPWDGGS